MNIHCIELLICIRCSKYFDLIINEYDYLIIFLWYCVEHATTSSERSLPGARGTPVARGACGNRDEGDDDNHQESIMGGGDNTLRRGVGGTTPEIFGGAKFMQGVFTAIEQMVRNTM